MKAIAFAIICAAYLLLPQKEVESLSDGMKNLHAFTMIICIAGFWISIIFEGYSK